MLKSPKDIEDYNEKAKFLKENGWSDLWHPDNWIKDEWRTNPRINIDWAGVGTETAYRMAKNNENEEN